MTVALALLIIPQSLKFIKYLRSHRSVDAAV
jgi:hypothetical protein